MSEQQQAAQRRGRIGGRWVNEQPSSEEFVEWFETSMKLDPQLDHKDYIGGVVLIAAVDEKVREVTGFNAEGNPIIETHAELTYTPYARVETRIAYFWDLMDVHPEWIGVVENVTPPRVPIDFITEEEVREGEQPVTVRRRQPGALSVLAHGLPDGFSIMSVPVDKNYTSFICCTRRVSIYKRGRNDEPEGLPLREGIGTKQVPLLTGRGTPWADPNALMKAETGAEGRALGFAGIFVIPGSGVATAEDVLESMSQGATPATATEGNQGPAAPEAVRTGAEQHQFDEDQLRTRAMTLYKGLNDETPEKAKEFSDWMRARRHQNVNEISGAALRGVVRKLEKLTDEAGQQAIEGGNGDVSAEAAAEPSPSAG